MNCNNCKNGETAPGAVTVSLNRGNTVVVVKDVPAEVCSNCGEYYLDAATAQRIYEQANAAVARRAEVEILQFAA
jgi:YgiT-type zinc finger domain-containing protein